MRCTGHCCDPVELSMHAFDTLTDPNKNVRDGDQIRSMLVFREWVDGWGARFYCCNFDRETRNCRVHDSKPEMCKAHGADGTCSVEGCTLRCG